MDVKTDKEMIIDEKAVQRANILDPKIYYEDTILSSNEAPAPDQKFPIPPFEEVLKMYSNKAERLRKQKSAVLKLMAEHDAKK